MSSMAKAAVGEKLIETYLDSCSTAALAQANQQYGEARSADAGPT